MGRDIKKKSGDVTKQWMRPKPVKDLGKGKFSPGLPWPESKFETIQSPDRKKKK